jgi:hypothetical protein
VVIAETRKLNADPRVVFRAVLAAYAESDLRNLANTKVAESYNYPHDGEGSSDNSCGLFQQRTPWWGTVADQMNPAVATQMFVKAYLRETRISNDPVADVWYTQRWGAPDPAVDPAGFHAAPQTVNYTRRVNTVQALIDNPRHFSLGGK